ncbi:MAG: hypothetical protein AAF202_14000, partial [Pseudomonadota bacterium]
MSLLLALPFALQGVFHFFDEFYYHRKREPLPRWELWSHPVDTAGVLILYLICLFSPLNSLSVAAYGTMFIFSCFSITKDEWIHHAHCSAGEHWLHSLLFVVHPLTLLAAGMFGLSRFENELGYGFLSPFAEVFYVFEWFALATALVLSVQIGKGVI